MSKSKLTEEQISALKSLLKVVHDNESQIRNSDPQRGQGQMARVSGSLVGILREIIDSLERCKAAGL